MRVRRRSSSQKYDPRRSSGCDSVGPAPSCRSSRRACLARQGRVLTRQTHCVQCRHLCQKAKGFRTSSPGRAARGLFGGTKPGVLCAPGVSDPMSEPSNPNESSPSQLLLPLRPALPSGGAPPRSLRRPRARGAPAAAKPAPAARHSLQPLVLRPNRSRRRREAGAVGAEMTRRGFFSWLGVAWLAFWGLRDQSRAARPVHVPGIVWSRSPSRQDSRRTTVRVDGAGRRVRGLDRARRGADGTRSSRSAPTGMPIRTGSPRRKFKCPATAAATTSAA
jgi:hypothetical protein